MGAAGGPPRPPSSSAAAASNSSVIPIDWTGELVKTIIHDAPSKFGSSSNSAAFMKEKIKLDYRDENGNTLLDLACMKRKTKIALNLIEAGIPLDTVDNFENTSLLLASSRGQKEIVEKILEKYHDNIDYINISKHTALYTALYNNHYAIAKLLLLHGANPKAGKQPLPNLIEAGITPEMLARKINVNSPVVAAAAAAGVEILPKYKGSESVIAVTNPLAAARKGGYKKSRRTRRRKTRKSLKRKSRR
jgi:hypothetical protein